MMTTEFQQWLRQKDACDEGVGWAAGLTPEQAWATCQKSDWMLWGLKRIGYADDRTLLLFACWCVRQVWDKLTDPRSRAAVETAERYARGEATKQELEDACSDACAAAAATDCEDHANYAALDTTDPDAWCAADIAATCIAKAARTVSPSGYIEARAAQAEELRRRIPWPVVEPLFEAALAVVAA